MSYCSVHVHEWKKPTVLDIGTRDTFKKAKRNLIPLEIHFTGMFFHTCVHQVSI